MRGVAICIMVPANMAPMLREPHPWDLRLVFSLAAPIFVIVAGMMVGMTAPRHGLGHYLGRGALIVLSGAFVDVAVWRSLPLTYFDILYLIGFSLPLAYLASRLSSKWIAAICVLIFALTPALQHLMGYTNTPPSYDLDGAMSTDPALVTTGLLNHVVIDGYFPLFPWTGMMLLGLLLARLHWSDPASAQRWRNEQALRLALGLVIVGAIVWRIWPGRLLEREGYGEMFYEPTIGFVLTASGCTLLVYWACWRSRASALWSPVRVLGEFSLFMYVFHLLVIGEAIETVWDTGEAGGWRFTLLWAPLLAAMVLIGYALHFIKARRRPKSYAARFVLGG